MTGSMVHSDGLFDDIEYEKGIDFMLNQDDKVQSARGLKETNEDNYNGTQKSFFSEGVKMDNTNIGGVDSEKNLSAKNKVINSSLMLDDKTKQNTSASD